MTESLKWSAQFQIAPAQRSGKLHGDKITLPQSVLEALLAVAPVVNVSESVPRNFTTTFDPFNPHSFAAERYAREVLSDRQQQLPHPLTFRLVNPENGRAVYAGIKEFSAVEGEIELSEFLSETLGFQTDSGRSTRDHTPPIDTKLSGVSSMKDLLITVHAKTLPKGTYVRLRPLEAGYDPEDWKSLLEHFLRANFTTLTHGEILDVPGARHEKFRFLVDKFEPEGDGICIVDTDLEVDIEALNEEQARETLSRRLAKAKKAPGLADGSSTGGLIALNEESHGQVLPGEYVDYELKHWNGDQDLEVSLQGADDADLDIFISPFSNHQRAKPRLDEHVFTDVSGRPKKRVKVSHTNVELETAEKIQISVYAWPNATESEQPLHFAIGVKTHLDDTEDERNGTIGEDEVVCKNCKQHIPKRTLPLHEAFCYRNNVSCPKCSTVFLKKSDAWKTHWHCPHHDAYGSGQVSRTKHDSIFHPNAPLQCPSCNFEAFDIPILAQHRTSTCPGKEILCQFCHLVVPQQALEDPSFTDPEVLMSGLTPHELTDGARTTECHICNKIVRLRDMRTHLRLHDRDRIAKPKPRLCVNAICGRTIKQSDEMRVQKEQLGLCSECFGPLYITTYDPEGKALRRRIERRLLQQLMAGCGKSWCHNADWCRTGRKNSTQEDHGMTAKEALPIVRPVLDSLVQGDSTALRFCVDQASQTRKATAEMMASEGLYEMEWCVKALEEEHNDINKASGWLADRAPKIGEIAR